MESCEILCKEPNRQEEKNLKNGKNLNNMLSDSCFILKQLDNSPSLFMNDSQLDYALIVDYLLLV